MTHQPPDETVDVIHVTRLADGRIRASIDGVSKIVPDNPANADRAAILKWEEAGGVIAAALPAIEDVRAEAHRRMMVLLGARDAVHLDVLISNGSREAIRLLRKGEGNWTEEEAARAAKLDQIDAAIEAVRAAGNVLEQLDPVPEDFASDSRWP